jgi:hypothetical protein
MPLPSPAPLRRRALLAGLAGTALAACRSPAAKENASVNASGFPAAAKRRLAEAPGLLPSLALLEGSGAAPALTVNGFSLAALGGLEPSDSLREELGGAFRRLTPLHPYFLRTGENTVRATYSEVGQAPAVAAVAWDYLESTEAKEIARWPAPAAPGGMEGRFTFAGRLPTWTWTTGPRWPDTPDTHAALRAELSRLWAEITAERADAEGLAARLAADTSQFLSACALRGRPETFLRAFVRAAATRRGPSGGGVNVVPLPDAAALTLDIFAGGSLARLVRAGGGPAFKLTSTGADGPRGQADGVVYAADPWFRRDADGAIRLDALYPMRAPDIWSGFVVSGRALDDLFLRSCF